MDQLNFHHLLYFWAAAREGGVVAAARRLLVAQPTVSAQIRALERALGQALFRRHGRRLELTEAGRAALRYADEIFNLGRELVESLHGRAGQSLRLAVGVADAVPKLIAYRLLEPAQRLPEGVELVCREGKPDRLLADLAVHDLDLVLADAPVPPSVNVRAFSHLLGESPLTLFGPPADARRLRRRFPRCLSEAPLLLPAENSTLHRALRQWFAAHSIRPRAVAQFEDSALMKAFGQGGAGLFFAPSVIAREVARQYGVARIADLPDVHERFYAISIERRIRHPAVLALSTFARSSIFGASAGPGGS